jgi:hypothetical protein
MNNPPAFPNDAAKHPFDKEGMTLRDYFAAKAMHALLNDVSDVAKTKLWISITAYSMADAMLKERET